MIPTRLVCRMWCFAAAALLGSVGSLRGDDRVAVRARADSQYVAEKFGAGHVRDETYVFAKGRFFGGATRDRSLEKMPFIDIARSLAAGLVKQHYFPTKDLRKADLFIVVHWGVTMVMDNSYQLMGRTSPIGVGAPDTQRLEMMHQMAEMERYYGNASDTSMIQFLDRSYEFNHAAALANDSLFQQMDRAATNVEAASNAQLLGFADDLRDDSRSSFGTAEGAMLRDFLRDERYFVILLAYDNQMLLKENKLRLRWSARLSMRSPGMNFPRGVVDMATVGGMVFGHQMRSVSIRRPTDRPTKVEIGPLRVIDMGGSAR